MIEQWRSVFGIRPKEVLVPPPELDLAVPPDTPALVRDTALLVPAFRRRVRAMLGRLRDVGHDPLVWETLRTKERALMLQRRGSSKNGAKSLHLYGCAVDVVCAHHMWDCKDFGCDFYPALGRAAKHAGLHWGGSLFPTFVDRPHVQAVRYRDQGKLRRARDVAAFVEQRLEAA